MTSFDVFIADSHGWPGYQVDEHSGSGTEEEYSGSGYDSDISGGYNPPSFSGGVNTLDKGWSGGNHQKDGKTDVKDSGEQHKPASADEEDVTPPSAASLKSRARVGLLLAAFIVAVWNTRQE